MTTTHYSCHSLTIGPFSGCSVSPYPEVDTFVLNVVKKESIQGSKCLRAAGQTSAKDIFVSLLSDLLSFLSKVKKKKSSAFKINIQPKML